ncbi:hypothetical protein POPTR_018G104801v4 [Populus trichocarpa]|uniref:Uncharacterized protein n=1 Tax=Populus trichocarpa TaxID=3694 RepID=A0ACC0RNJ9_POPTR|nr:hypothetical protein POPTR_018G104801v4 [Populus trichocarpa]
MEDLMDQTLFALFCFVLTQVYSHESVVTRKSCYLGFMCFVPEFHSDMLVFA